MSFMLFKLYRIYVGLSNIRDLIGSPDEFVGTWPISIVKANSKVDTLMIQLELSAQAVATL